MITLETFDELAYKLENSFTHINRGGCAVIATILYPHMRKYFKNVKYIVVEAHYYVENAKSIATVRRKITNSCDNRFEKSTWGNHSIHMGHVLLQFEHDGKNYFFDTHNGVVHQKTQVDLGGTKYKVYKGHFLHKEMTKLADEKAGWNTCFNRRQIPKIKEFVANFLKRNG